MAIHIVVVELAKLRRCVNADSPHHGDGIGTLGECCREELKYLGIHSFEAFPFGAQDFYTLFYTPLCVGRA